MSYQALYRKYRPSGFDGMIGQEHIVRTLCNQISTGRVSHAYLFTGSRGTGKTSCAKIFARAVNCEKPNAGSPCGKCDVCKALSGQENIDILEIDAASNNKVDEIRDLREKVQYRPVKGKYKVYIIDEVHMLTDSAFNALLKTLEEPPEFVIFILATTEAYKLPQTILSRCLRFDFRLVSEDVLAAHIADIYKKEGKAFEDSAVAYIAAAGEGSVRDCLSIADMCLNYSDGKLLYSDVLKVLGATDKSKISSLLLAISGGDIRRILEEIDELYKSGKSMTLVVKETAKYARDLLALKTVGESLVYDTKENIERMKKEADGMTDDFLITLIKQFSSLENELRYTVSPRIITEAAAIRSAKLMSGDISALTERVRRLEENGVQINSSVTDAQNSPSARAAAAVSSVVAATKVPPKPNDAKSIWGRLATQFRETGEMALYTLLCNHHSYRIDGDIFVISAADETFLKFSEPAAAKAINNALALDGQNLKIRVEKAAGEPDMDDQIEKIKKLMGGAEINIKK